MKEINLEKRRQIKLLEKALAKTAGPEWCKEIFRHFLIHAIENDIKPIPRDGCAWLVIEHSYTEGQWIFGAFKDQEAAEVTAELRRKQLGLPSGGEVNFEDPKLEKWIEVEDMPLYTVPIQIPDSPYRPRPRPDLNIVKKEEEDSGQ